MSIREAQVNDIRQLMIVRFAVKENVLSNPALVTPEDNEEYLTVRGKGWVCEIDSSIVGFSIVDLIGHSIWALFVLPEYEKKGIGKQLQNTMFNWYFSQSKEKLWLETAAGQALLQIKNIAANSADPSVKAVSAMSLIPRAVEALLKPA